VPPPSALQQQQQQQRQRQRDDVVSLACVSRCQDWRGGADAGGAGAEMEAASGRVLPTTPTEAGNRALCRMDVPLTSAEPCTRSQTLR
jgi:hypothetical protein